MTSIPPQDSSAAGPIPAGPIPAWMILRSAVLPAGYSDGYLRRARRSGALVVVLPGVYLSSADLADLGLWEWHLATVAAAVSRLTGGPVVSHLSAALLHGLRPLTWEQRPVHITRCAPAKSRRGPRIVAHRAELAVDDVVSIAGLRVTTATRTALDCAFLLPHHEAVALLTAAIGADSLAPELLLGRLSGYRRVPGVRQVAEAVEEALVHAAGDRDEPVHSPTVISTRAASGIGSADSQE